MAVGWIEGEVWQNEGEEGSREAAYDRYGVDYGGEDQPEITENMPWWDQIGYVLSGFGKSVQMQSESWTNTWGNILTGDFSHESLSENYDKSSLGQTKDDDGVAYYGTRGALAVSTAAITAAAMVGFSEFAFLGNKSILVEANWLNGSGGLCQLRIEGTGKYFRLDWHQLPGLLRNKGRLPHIDTPQYPHWPW